MDSKDFGFQGLKKPFTTINASGQKVTYYPDGTIQNNETGTTNTKTLYSYTPQTNNNNNELIIAIIGIVAIVAIVGVVAICKKTN